MRISASNPMLLGAVLWLLASGAPAQSAAPTAASRIAQQYLNAVATVISLDENRQPLALGSGFFVDHQGQLVTNAHVIEGAASVVVRWRSERKEAIRVSRFDPKYDLVVVDTGFQSSSPITIADSRSVAVGEEVVVLGNPRGLEGSVSTGIVSALREIAGVQYLQITAPISPGSSGGPVFNTSGRVIGIATATVTRGQNLNFAVAATVLHDLPPVNLKFKAVKAAPIEASDTSRWRDLVRPTNVIEDIAQGIGWLSGVTFSIQNDARVVISNVTVLLIVRGPRGQPLDFALVSFDEAIPSGLAKQVRIPKGFGTLNVRGYAEPSRDPREYGKFTEIGSVELRILDFKTLTGDTQVDQLLRQR